MTTAIERTTESPVNHGGAATPAASESRDVAPVETQGLTRSQRRELERRQKIMAEFHKLKKLGHTYQQAATALGSSAATLWRWERNGIQSKTNRCGCRSLFSHFNVPEHTLCRVQQLQLSGMSNAEAWLKTANEPDCPALVAALLKTAGKVPTSFLKATKLEKVTVTAVKGRNFFCLTNPPKL